MDRPPASKSQKIRTGNYYLIWSGLTVTVTRSSLRGDRITTDDTAIPYDRSNKALHFLLNHENKCNICALLFLFSGSHMHHDTHAFQRPLYTPPPRYPHVHLVKKSIAPDYWNRVTGFQSQPLRLIRIRQSLTLASKATMGNPHKHIRSK